MDTTSTYRRDRHYIEVKRPAHAALNKAIKAGEVIRLLDCEHCGGRSKGGRGLCGHHPDYSKPLEVVWLCARCHVNLHVAERGGRRSFNDWAAKAAAERRQLAALKAKYEGKV